MSRGHGAIERYILEQLQGRELTPVNVLARHYAEEGRVADTLALRSSFRRAVHRLTDEGATLRCEILAPTRFQLDGDGSPQAGSHRWVLCVALPDVDLSPGLLADAASRSLTATAP